MFLEHLHKHLPVIFQSITAETWELRILLDDSHGIKVSHAVELLLIPFYLRSTACFSWHIPAPSRLERQSC